MGAQGEFVKYEPLGGTYSMWRPEGNGGNGAEGDASGSAGAVCFVVISRLALQIT